MNIMRRIGFDLRTRVSSEHRTGCQGSLSQPKVPGMNTRTAMRSGRALVPEMAPKRGCEVVSLSGQGTDV